MTGPRPHSKASNWILAGLLAGLILSCRREAPWVSLTPGRPNLVVLFRAGTDVKAKNRFLAEEIDDAQRPGSTGEDLRPGIRSLVLTEVGRYEGYVVGLDPRVTELERQRIKQHISASRFVYRVFENVLPEQILLKEGEPLPLVPAPR